MFLDDVLDNVLVLFTGENGSIWVFPFARMITSDIYASS